MSANQAPHHAPDEPVARALALAELGHSNVEIGELVGHSERTVRRWIARSREVSGNKPILDKWTRRSSQALDLIQDGLDLIEEDESRLLALKNLTTLNIIAGTGTDKLQKEQDIQSRQRSTQVAQSLVDAISRLAQLDTSNLARIIDAEYSVVEEVKDV